jgi:hypothetical protein
MFHPDRAEAFDIIFRPLNSQDHVIFLHLKRVDPHAFGHFLDLAILHRYLPPLITVNDTT